MQRRRILGAIRAGHGNFVQRGPFRGMRYLAVGSWGEVGPKLLGSYEAELHGHIEELVAEGFPRVVNVGCAEGYYAVGLARRLPDAIVFAFDVDPYAQHLCRRLAAKNGVADRVRVDAECTPARLGELVAQRSLVVVDCEGCEGELLDPALVPGLQHADLVVELHDFTAPMVSTTLANRFSASHTMTVIDAEDKDPSSYPELRGLPMPDQIEAVAEHRPGPMQWMVLRARVSGSTSPAKGRGARAG